MTTFTDAMARVEARIDATFAVSMVVTPMQSGEFVASSPRTDIQSFEIMGVPDIDGQTMGVTGTRYKAKIDANLQGYNAVISALKSQFSFPLRPVPVARDLIAFDYQGDRVTFAIGVVRPDAEGRYHFLGEVVSRELL